MAHSVSVAAARQGIRLMARLSSTTFTFYIQCRLVKDGGCKLGRVLKSIVGSLWEFCLVNVMVDLMAGFL